MRTGKSLCTAFIRRSCGLSFESSKTSEMIHMITFTGQTTRVCTFFCASRWRLGTGTTLGAAKPVEMVSIKLVWTMSNGTFSAAVKELLVYSPVSLWVWTHKFWLSSEAGTSRENRTDEQFSVSSNYRHVIRNVLHLIIKEKFYAKCGGISANEKTIFKTAVT